MRARYDARVEDGAVVLEDIGGGRSVTNDAEAVVADLAARGFDLTLPVIYRDTMGAWDGIAVRGGAFAGFYSLGAARTDHAAARAALRALVEARDPRLCDAVPLVRGAARLPSSASGR